MNVSRRALVGAAVGALLVLIAHPSTRPALLAAFRPRPKGGLNALLARPPLAKPKDQTTGAAFLHAGADRLLRGPALKEAEVSTMIQIAGEGVRTDADNAFWPLARFVFRKGVGETARKDWSAASRRRLYNDYQSQSLIVDRDRVAEEVGDVQAWIYAAVAPQRSDALARKIKEIGLITLQAMPVGPDRTDFAYETIQNGARLRDGGRRLEIGFLGVDLIEGATYRPDMTPTAIADSPKRLWIAKGLLTADLRKHRTVAEAVACDREFRVNDSWEVFRDVENPEDRRRLLTIAAVIVGTLPGGFLAASLAGGLVWLFGRRIAVAAAGRDRFRGAGLTACSLGLLGLGAGLGYPWIGLTAGACALVPALTPERPRRFDGSSLGPLHAFVVGCLAAAILLGGSIVAIGRSLPGSILNDQGSFGAWLGDVDRWGAFLVATLGASALVPPAWAIVRRLPTPAIAAKTYRDLGRNVAYLGLGLAIVSSPISFALDRWIGDGLAKIALNEQVYYNPSVAGDR